MKNVNENKVNNKFTEDDLKKLNFTPEELELLSDANALVDTVNMLPEEPDGILNHLDKNLPDDLNGAFEKLTELAQKDPEYVKLLIAMNEIFGEVREVPANGQKSPAKK